MKLLPIIITVISVLGSVFGQFEVPDALVEVLKPRGLRVSIPDVEGIKLFAFHGKINEEMNGREGGFFSRDITKAKNGRWTFYEPTAQLKVGDILYYWTYADYFDGRNKLGYPKDDQKFVVTELLDMEPTAPTIDIRLPPIEETTSSPPQQVTLPNGCKKSVTTVRNQQVCEGVLIFNDNFTNFKDKHWSPEVRFAGEPDYEFVLYLNRPENVAVQKGQLEIRPIPTDDVYGEGFVTSGQELNLGLNCTGATGTDDCVQKQSVSYLILPPVTSGLITTKNKWSFRYGKVEIRAKLPKGNWIYPELYLNSETESYGPGYDSGQMRVAFLPGNRDASNNLHGGCVLGNSTLARNYAIKNIRKTKGAWTDGFHKYTLIWTPDHVTVSVDDQVYGNIYAPDGGFASEAHSLDLGNVDRWRTGTKFAPFDQEMYLAIGVGVGGYSVIDREDGSKPWKNNDPKGQKNFYKAKEQWLSTWGAATLLKVDYVKVWAL